MRSNLLFISLVLIALVQVASAQVVINEISYNPPESGVDSLEYIEILNTGNNTINIEGWYFMAGIEDTLPNIDLAPGEYFVTAGNAQAMMNVFGIVVHEWAGGALANDGELITLVDSGGGVVDSVRFEDSDPWPSEPDGDGPSLELIDSGLDNADASNWQFSGGATGVIINGNEVSGTPGAANSGGGNPGPALTIDLVNFMFNPNIAVVQVGDVVRWVNNEGHAHNVNGQQSTFPGNPESFTSGAPAGGPWQFEFQFLIPGTYQYRCDPHAGMGMTGTIYVYDPLIYNDFPLEVLRLNNENGSALFDGVPTTINGVVHGVNFQPDAYSFYIINESNVGINVFSFDSGAYVVAEGDELSVSGTIDQFNGLLEIIPDTIELLNSGNTRNDPRNVTEITEEDESSYIYTDLLEVDSVSNISSSGYTIYTTHDSGNKLLVRVDSDANIPIQPEEIMTGAWLQVFGIGSQFDNSFPFTEGYQLLALEVFDIVDGVQLLDKNAIALTPNPAADIIQLSSDVTISEIQIFSLDGRSVYNEVINHSSARIQIGRLTSGLHIIKAITDEGIWTSMLSVVK